MTPKVPGKHADIGMPKRSQTREEQISQKEDDRVYASRDRALELATALAGRNAELMRRLA